MLLVGPKASLTIDAQHVVKFFQVSSSTHSVTLAMYLIVPNAPRTIDAQHVVKFFQVGLRKHSVALAMFLVAPRLEGAHSCTLCKCLCKFN